MKEVSEPECTKMIYNKENSDGNNIGLNNPIIQPFNERDELLDLYVEHLDISFNYNYIPDNKNK